MKHKRWLILESLTISHLGKTRPYVSCGGCLREPGPIRESKLVHGTITFSGVNWLLRGRFAALIEVFRKGRTGRVVALRARFGKKPALVFEGAACLRALNKLIRCPQRTAKPVSGTPVTTTPASTEPATTAPPATTVQPIGSPTLSAAASGDTITFIGSVPGNGSAISVSVTDTTDGSTHSCGSGTGVVNCNWTETGLRYGTPYIYRITAVDASGSGRGSVSAQTSASTSAPPPIQNATLSGSVTGTSINVSGSVNDGGLAANVTLRDNTNGATGSCTTSGDYVSCSMSESGLSYSKTYSYTLTATDASGYGRATQLASWSGTTGYPPPPGQAISIGWSTRYSGWIWMSETGFSGTVAYVCHEGGVAYGPYYWNISATGNPVDNGATCLDTSPVGEQVYVTIGSVASNTITVP